MLDSLAPRKRLRRRLVPQVVLVNGGGTTQAVSPGSPFLLGAALLPAGGTTTFVLSFHTKGPGVVTFNPVVLAGYTQP